MFFKKFCAVIVLMIMTLQVNAQVKSYFGTLPDIKVSGKNLVDPNGRPVVLHGIMETPNAYFNKGLWTNGVTWADYSQSTTITKCLAFFTKMFDAVQNPSKGTYANLFRLHLDPCWLQDNSIVASGFRTENYVEGGQNKTRYYDPHGNVVDGEANICRFSIAKFRTYLQSVYIPIIKDAIAHGLYVIVRPPGVFPHEIVVGDYYNDYLMTVWDIVSSDSYIKSKPGQISLELGNEPVHIWEKGTTNFTQNYYGYDWNRSTLYDFFQPIVNKIRSNGFNGIIWLPGTGYQAEYRSYNHKMVSDPKSNIAFAVHFYPGWYGTTSNDANCAATNATVLSTFKTQIPVQANYPIVITEVDWSPTDGNSGHYDEHGSWVTSNFGTWGTGSTSEKSKFGDQYKYVVDQCGNVSWTIEGADLYVDLATYLKNGTVQPAFIDKMKAAGYTDAYQACSGAGFKWFKEYASGDYVPMPLGYSDGAGSGSGTGSTGIIATGASTDLSTIKYYNYDSGTKEVSVTPQYNTALAAGAELYGVNGNVYYKEYADLSGYTRMVIKGNGGTLRLLFNRQTDGGATTEINPSLESGTATVDLTNIDANSFVHLHSIKMAWGNAGNTTITSIELYNDNDNTKLADYYFTGEGDNTASVTAALSDAKATVIDITGYTGTEAKTFTSTNPNCLFIYDTDSKVGNVYSGNTVKKNSATNYSAWRITLTDGYNFRAPVNVGTAAKDYDTTNPYGVSYKRTLTSEWAATALPFDLNVSYTGSPEIYTLSAVGNGKMGVTKVNGGTISAGTVILYHNSAKGTTTLYGDNLTKTPTDLDIKATAVNGWYTAQCYAAKTISNVTTDATLKDYDVYKMNGDKFEKVTGSLTMEPFRAYFLAKKSVVTSTASSYSISTTGVEPETAKPITTATTWDFSEFSSTITASGDNYETLYRNITIYGNPDGSVTTETYGTNGFKCNGKSSETTRYIKLTAGVDGMLTVYFKSNNTADNERITAIGTAVGTLVASNTQAKCSQGQVSATLTAGQTYYVYFVTGGQTITKLTFAPGEKAPEPEPETTPGDNGDSGNTGGGDSENTGGTITGSLTLTQNNSYTATSDATYTQGVILQLNIAKAGLWNALYVPFAINVDIYAGELEFAEIYNYAPTEDTNGDGTIDANDQSKLIVAPKRSGNTQPNKPYLVKAKSAGLKNIASADNKVYAAQNATVTCSTTNKQNTFTGIYASTEANTSNNYYYVSERGTLSRRSAGKHVMPPFSWYMISENATTSNKPVTYSLKNIAIEE